MRLTVLTIGYNAQLSFINGVEAIQEIPKLEISIHTHETIKIDVM